MPQKPIDHVSEIGRQHGMPSKIRDVNWHGREIEDELEDFEDDD
jgi:hypothetical protein